MYAVIRSGGKQLRVEPGQQIRVEKLAGEAGDIDMRPRRFLQRRLCQHAQVTEYGIERGSHLMADSGQEAAFGGTRLFRRQFGLQQFPLSLFQFGDV